MSMFENLKEEFRRLEGHPVRVIMTDRHSFCGIVLTVCDFSCRLLDRCGDILLVEYSHIVAVEEPRMHLPCHSGRNCWEDFDCNCHCNCHCHEDHCHEEECEDHEEEWHC